MAKKKTVKKKASKKRLPKIESSTIIFDDDPLAAAVDAAGIKCSRAQLAMLRLACEMFYDDGLEKTAAARSQQLAAGRSAQTLRKQAQASIVFDVLDGGDTDNEIISEKSNVIIENYNARQPDKSKHLKSITAKSVQRYIKDRLKIEKSD